MVALRREQTRSTPLHAGTGSAISRPDGRVRASGHRVHRVVFESGFRDTVAGDAGVSAGEEVAGGRGALESVLGGDGGKDGSEEWGVLRADWGGREAEDGGESGSGIGEEVVGVDGKGAGGLVRMFFGD